MKKQHYLLNIGRQLISAMLLLWFAATLNSCEEDAPAYSHTAADLNGAWTDDDGREYNITQLSDNEFVIENFEGIGEITVTISSDTQLSFEGSLRDGLILIKNGTGTITNGWLTMRMQYDMEMVEDNETEHFDIMLNKGKGLSKKAVSNPRI